MRTHAHHSHFRTACLAVLDTPLADHHLTQESP